MTFKTKTNILAYYQIAGGVAGFAMTIWFFAKSINHSSLVIFILLLALILYSFSIYCGWQLLSGETEKGLRLSLINQAMQAINFSISGFAFKYISGLCILISFDLTDSFYLTFSAALSTFEAKFNSDRETVIVGVNIVAFYVIYRVGKLQREIKQGRIVRTSQPSLMLDSDLITEKEPVE